MKAINTFWNKYRLKKPLVIIYLVFFLITLSLIITGYIYYGYQKEKIVNNRYEYLASVSGFNNSQIIDWLNNKTVQLEVLRTNSMLIKKIESVASSVSIGELTEWLKTLKTLFQYESILLVGNSNKVIYSLPESKMPITGIDSLFCINSKDSDQIFFSDSDENSIEQTGLKFYVPLKSSQVSSQAGKIVMILTIDPKNTFNYLLNRNIDKSPTQEALLVKSVNNNIIYLNDLKLRDNIKEFNKNINRKPLIDAYSIKGRKNFLEGVDYKNDPVIAVMQSIPATTWTLITKIDRSEFYSPVNDLERLIVLAIISADLVFALVFFFIWRKSILANFKKMYTAELEKAKSENRFDSLVNGVKDIAIIILDDKGNIVSWNDGAEIIEGYTAQEIIGKHISIFYPHEEIANNKPYENLKYAFEKDSFQEENWRIKKDGTAFWANVLLTSLKDKSGIVYGYLKVTRDLTGKRKAEEEIRKSRDFYLKLLDDFPTPVWRSGLDSRFDYFNKAWLNFTGKSIMEEIGDLWINDIHPEEREKIVQIYSDAFRQKKNFSIEYRLKKFNGEYKWMLDFGMPYYDLENNFCGYIGTCYDVDDRRKYEETINALLRISEQLYSSLDTDQILDSLIIESIKMTNTEGGYACLITENTYEVKRYYHSDHWEYCKKQFSRENGLIKRLIEVKETLVLNEEDGLVVADAELIDKYNVRNCIVVPLNGSDGDLIGYFEIHNKKDKKRFNIEDVNLLNAVARNASISIAKSLNYEQLRKTENQLRISETELRNLAMQLQYARETERQHIAREVHDELGQLFTGINLNVSLLTELLEQNQKPTVEEILNELRYVQKYVSMGIQAVRDISGSLRSYILDHLGLIPAVQEYCREIERMSNVKCNFSSKFESLKFQDEKNVALFRIIQEAITNVLRHAEATIIDVSINQSGSDLEIIISDNGIGLTEENEGTSSSMGLLGMKERAIFLDGRLKIESSKNNGTTIHLLIPLAEKANKTGSK